MSLRARLLAAAAALVASLALCGFLIVRTVENSELHQIDNQLRASAPIALGIARNSQAVPSRPPTTFPEPQRINTLSDRYLALIVNGKRTTLLAPEAARGQRPKTPSVVAQSVGSARPQTVGSLNGSGRWRAILLKSPGGNQNLVAVYMGPVDATTSQLRTAVFAAGGIVAVILLAVGFWIERLGLRPIAMMRTVAEAVVAGDRKRRVTAGAPVGETANLASALNSMLDQQNAVEDRLRQFLADASHELRTPTSVISGLAQLWRQGELRDGQALEEAMRRIGQESARMKALVEELLLLARLDEGMPLRSESVDICELVQDVLETGRSTHPSRSITTELDSLVSVQGEPAALRRLISNVITNALIHTPSSSPVTVKVARRGDDAVFEVSDSGPGMNSVEAAHAFDRFWRGDASRTRTGSGLGLPIAEAIVSAHKGTIRFDTAPDRGTTVRVVLPLESRQHQGEASKTVPQVLGATGE